MSDIGAPETGEKEKIPTLADFIEHKTMQLTKQEEIVSGTLSKLAEDSSSVPANQLSRAIARRDRLNGELFMLQGLVGSLAGERLAIIIPESSKTYWELSGAEQARLKGSITQTDLKTANQRFEEITQDGEQDYKTRFGGKRYDEMTTEEQANARELSFWLDVRDEMSEEMSLFKKM